MSPDERRALEALLQQMRATHAELTQHHAGVCVLHMEAAIASLESHLRRNDGAAMEMLRRGLTSSSTSH